MLPAQLFTTPGLLSTHMSESAILCTLLLRTQNAFMLMEKVKDLMQVTINVFAQYKGISDCDDVFNMPIF
jgi:hypothetical protein